MAEYDISDWVEAQNRFRRATKRDIKASHDMHGWRTQPKRPKMRQLTSSLGNTYQTPEDDYQDYMRFFRAATDAVKSDKYTETGKARDIKTPADYIDFAFGKNTKAPVIEQEGVGHIAYMWYASRYQVLKVQFVNNGSVVAYFRVPNTIVATLFDLAQTGTTRYTENGQRHLLGIYFWDLIRIRGTVHGSRYKFEYVQDNSSGNLAGRPYGSGENYWTTETGPNKNIALAKDNRDAAIALKHLISSNPELALSMINGKRENKITQDELLGLLSKFDSDIAEYDKRITELEAAQNKEVTRKVSHSIMPDDLVDNLGNFKALTNRIGSTPTQNEVDAYNAESIRKTGEMPNQSIAEFDEHGKPRYNYVPLSKQQRAEMQDALTTRAEVERVTKLHNQSRKQNILWDVDRIDSLVDKLGEEGKLGKGGVNNFYNHLPNVEDQFNYLKARGFIPENAKFR